MRQLLAAVAILLLAAWSAQATVYTLYPDGTGDYPTIQAAINGCVNGDVIQLADGSYTGPGNREIDFNGRTITLRSISGNAEACVIDIQGIHSNIATSGGCALGPRRRNLSAARQD